MLLSSFVINELMAQLEDTTILSKSCESIKAYEGKNLPVPIKKTYLSFSVSENKTTYFLNEQGEKMQNTDLVICINCYSPLNTSPANTHTVAETVMHFFASANSLIDSFSIGATEYDKDVDAYKIPCKLYYKAVQKADTE